jgi:nicotinamidase-related amidase
MFATGSCRRTNAGTSIAWRARNRHAAQEADHRASTIGSARSASPAQRWHGAALVARLAATAPATAAFWQSGLAAAGRLPLSSRTFRRIAAMRTALIVIDLINDIVHPAGAFAAAAPEVAARGVIARANALAARARRDGAPVGLVRVGFPRGYPNHPDHSPLFGPARQKGALMLGSWGTEFHPDFVVDPGDTAIVKPRVSAFHGTEFAELLAAWGTQRLVICGVSTEMGVLTTARDAHDRDFQVVVAADACASGNPALHDAALAMLARTGAVLASDAVPID